MKSVFIVQEVTHNSTGSSGGGPRGVFSELEPALEKALAVTGYVSKWNVDGDFVCEFWPEVHG